MAGALGMLLGAGLQYASGYANEKLQQKQQQEAAAHSAMQDALANTPGFAETPEGQKALKNMVGPEYAPMRDERAQVQASNDGEGTAGIRKEVMGGGGGSAAPSASTQMVGAAGGGGRFSQPQQIVRQAPNQMPPMSVTGPNSPPEPTSVGTAPQPTNGSAMPNDPATLRDTADRSERWLSGSEAQELIANGMLTKTQVEMGKAHIAQLREQAKEIETEQQRALYDSPEAKAKATTATTQAKIDTENSPANLATRERAQAGIGAARGGAEARSKLAPDIVKGEVDLQRQKSTAEAEAKAAVASKVGKPWTPKDGAQLRSTISASVDREMTSPSMVGKLFSGASLDEKKAEIDRRMLALGVLPDGQRISDVHGAQVGYDKTTGKISGYVDGTGQWHDI